MVSVHAPVSHRGTLVSAWSRARRRRRPRCLMQASGTNSPAPKSVKVKGYASAPATVSSRSLYPLTCLQGAKIKGAGACRRTWLPVLVRDSVTRITLEQTSRETLASSREVR